MKNQYRFFFDNNFNELKHQIFNVLRLKSGDKITLVSDGREYLCELTGDNYRIIEDITCDREPSVSLTLAVSLLKKDKFEYILEKCTEIGVSEFIVFPGDRSVRQMNEKDFLRHIDRYRKIVREACEQSLRLKEPNIFYKEMKDIDFHSYDEVYITAPEGVPLKQKLNKDSKKILLFIGPEGGFSSDECDFVLENGGQTVSFGKRIMKSETSAMVISGNIVNFYE